MTVNVREYEAPEVNKREIHRYAGERAATNALSALIDECLAEILPRLVYKVAFCEAEVKISGQTVDLGFGKIESRALTKNLSGCTRAIVFAATVGLAPDRLVARNLVVSPTKALVFDAIGSERIEELCDVFCADAAKGRNLRPRFSAGYGDFSIDAQKDIFRLLDCPKNIGLSLTENLLMTPTKSVTAIVGIF